MLHIPKSPLIIIMSEEQKQLEQHCEDLSKMIGVKQ